MKILLILVVLFAAGCTSNTKTSSSGCTQRMRALMDLGSGTTKLTLGEVEVCQDSIKLIRIVGDSIERPVALEASKDKNGNLSSQAMSEALNTLNSLREEALRIAKAKNYGELDLSVVATHAVRTAGNQEEFLRQLRNAGYSIRVLTQDEEGASGFEAVRASPLPESCSRNKLLVWDVGGGSTQFVRMAGSETQVVKYQLGAESYRKKLLEKFKVKKSANCALNPESPNPLAENFKPARVLVNKEMRLNSATLQSEQACVVGIGGVHNKAVDAQIEKNWQGVASCVCGSNKNCDPTEKGYRKKELECLADMLAQKSDCSPEIQGPYSDTAVSNLAMILGFMDGLKIEKVYVMPLNMGHYFVSDGKRLKFNTLKVN